MKPLEKGDRLASSVCGQLNCCFTLAPPSLLIPPPSLLIPPLPLPVLVLFLADDFPYWCISN